MAILGWIREELQQVISRGIKVNCCRSIDINFSPEYRKASLWFGYLITATLLNLAKFLVLSISGTATDFQVGKVKFSSFVFIQLVKRCKDF